MSSWKLCIRKNAFRVGDELGCKTISLGSSVSRPTSVLFCGDVSMSFVHFRACSTYIIGKLVGICQAALLQQSIPDEMLSLCFFFIRGHLSCVPWLKKNIMMPQRWSFLLINWSICVVSPCSVLYLWLRIPLTKAAGESCFCDDGGAAHCILRCLLIAFVC